MAAVDVHITGNINEDPIKYVDCLSHVYLQSSFIPLNVSKVDSIKLASNKVYL